jgi:hypothetical protein
MAKGVSRDRRREAEWRRAVREQKRSGLTIRDFCRRGKLRETAFYFWRGELQRRQAEQEQHRPARSPAAPAFVAVRLEEHDAGADGGSPAGGHIEILLSGGRRVHVMAPVDRQVLADVLAVLEGRPC